MSVAFVPVFIPAGVTSAGAVPPPPKPFPGWIASSQRSGAAPEPASDARPGSQPVRQVVEAFKKTRICRFYPRCNKGDACRFAHAPEEVRARPNMTKTRMCAGFYDGRCQLPPEECNFAHGEEELRAREVPYFGTWMGAATSRSVCGDATPTAGSVAGQPWTRRDSSSLFSTHSPSVSGTSSSAGDSTPRAEAAGEREKPSDAKEAEASAASHEGEQPGVPAVPGTPEVHAILAEWTHRIRSMSGAGDAGVEVGRSPTHGEHLEALIKAMPDYYED